MKRDKIIDFIMDFMKDVNSEVHDMKLAVNHRARVVANSFLSQFF